MEAIKRNSFILLCLFATSSLSGLQIERLQYHPFIIITIEKKGDYLIDEYGVVLNRNSITRIQDNKDPGDRDHKRLLSIVGLTGTTVSYYFQAFSKEDAIDPDVNHYRFSYFRSIEGGKPIQISLVFLKGAITDGEHRKLKQTTMTLGKY